MIATTVIVLSIFFRLGAIEAVLRFYFLTDEYDPRQVVRTGFWGLLISTTVGVAIYFALSGPLTTLLLRDCARRRHARADRNHLVLVRDVLRTAARALSRGGEGRVPTRWRPSPTC